MTAPKPTFRLLRMTCPKIGDLLIEAFDECPHPVWIRKGNEITAQNEASRGMPIPSPGPIPGPDGLYIATEWPLPSGHAIVVAMRIMDDASPNAPASA